MTCYKAARRMNRERKLKISSCTVESIKPCAVWLEIAEALSTQQTPGAASSLGARGWHRARLPSGSCQLCRPALHPLPSRRAPKGAGSGRWPPRGSPTSPSHAGLSPGTVPLSLLRAVTSVMVLVGSTEVAQPWTPHGFLWTYLSADAAAQDGVQGTQMPQSLRPSTSGHT